MSIINLFKKKFNKDKEYLEIENILKQAIITSFENYKQNTYIAQIRYITEAMIKLHEKNYIELTKYLYVLMNHQDANIRYHAKEVLDCFPYDDIKKIRKKSLKNKLTHLANILTKAKYRKMISFHEQTKLKKIVDDACNAVREINRKDYFELVYILPYFMRDPDPELQRLSIETLGEYVCAPTDIDERKRIFLNCDKDQDVRVAALRVWSKQFKSTRDLNLFKVLGVLLCNNIQPDEIKIEAIIALEILLGHGISASLKEEIASLTKIQEFELTCKKLLA